MNYPAYMAENSCLSVLFVVLPLSPCIKPQLSVIKLMRRPSWDASTAFYVADHVL